MGQKMNFLEIKTKADLCKYINIKEKELNFLLYSKKNFYSSHFKNKKTGGKRLISSPNKQLKYVQHMLKKGFEEFYESQNNFSFVNGFTKNKSISTNANSHINQDFVLNIDIKNFFPSITFKRIHGLLTSKKAFNFPDDIAIMIANLVTYNKQLPQGAPTSPILSNIICHNLDCFFDRWMKKSQKKITYTRYADDISFSGKYDSLHLVFDTKEKTINPNLINIFTKNGFVINEEKTRLQHYCNHQEVTGIKVNQKPNVSKHFLFLLRSMIHSWEKYTLDKAYEEYCNKKQINYDSKNSSDYIRVVLGMLSYMKMIKGYDDSTYSSLALRVNTLLKKDVVPYKSSYDDIVSNSVFQIWGKIHADLGTCFRIKDYLVTCKHCIESNDPLECYSIVREGQTLVSNIKVLYKSKDHDFALLSAEKLYDKQYINLAAEKIRAKQDVTILGFPMADKDDKISEQTGQVIGHQVLSGINIYKDNYFITAASIQQGNSGGPVLNKDNDLVGIICVGNEDPDSNTRNGSLPLDTILKEIEYYESTLKAGK